MKYAIFGDESTLPGMQSILGAAVALSVVASNRPQAIAAVGETARVQPARTAPERAAFLSFLKALAPDVILCFSYSMILDADLLAIPPLGAINVHGGLLPRYRGANVLNWALVEGAELTGVTAHYMTLGIDEGDIIFQELTPISDDDTALTLKRRLDAMGMNLILRIHQELGANRQLPRRAQDAALVRYYRRRRPEDGKIDWASMSDRDVFNLIRSQVKPWPGAYCEAPNGSRAVFDWYHTLDDVAALRKKYGA
jgi:methionyl-tRNA formyltransferase